VPPPHGRASMARPPDPARVGGRGPPWWEARPVVPCTRDGALGGAWPLLPRDADARRAAARVVCGTSSVYTPLRRWWSTVAGGRGFLGPLGKRSSARHVTPFSGSKGTRVCSTLHWSGGRCIRPRGWCGSLTLQRLAQAAAMIGNRLWGGLSGPYGDCAAGLTGASQAKAALCQAWWSATTA